MNAILQSCWFHFCQALRRNVSSKFKHLAELLRSNKTASIHFHKFMALPLLPDYCIESAFIMLQKKINDSFTDNQFKLFLEYFENQWMKKVRSFKQLSLTLCSELSLRKFV